MGEWFMKIYANKPVWDAEYTLESLRMVNYTNGERKYMTNEIAERRTSSDIAASADPLHKQGRAMRLRFHVFAC